ncbi:KICSTOR complex protein SZT2-like [Pollicipes pollicipes]|uniref:KICSTOR complex protein SZT2-like n=1 Tax=Pollicipes pollicipes TaxID=41117 RepID=UPI00188522E4|nr:KICSTOR complex protein SZT2-like [Pollicipes pollicipes]
MLLLQELESSRFCDNLLEPESSADLWQADELHGLSASYSRPGAHSPDDLNRHYLEANLKFQAGHFACPVTWCAQFALHPRLRGPAHAAAPGLAYLRQALETFAVTNRRNMFVFKDPKLEQVFYLRLQECCAASARASGDSASALSLDERLSLQPGRPSITSLKDEPARGRCTSVGERETSSRAESGEGIMLMVHGITEPGPSIKEDLVELLYNRLDERLLELFSKALLRNPQTKLAPEDVHFIQRPGAPPDHSLKFTLPPSAVPHLDSVVGYLRNNLLQLLHQPKYTDSREENHFRDWGSSGDSDMFLYLPSEKHGGRGMACVSLSTVRPSAPPPPPPLPLLEAAAIEWTPAQFEALTSTKLYDPQRDGPDAVLLQFNIWEKGRANLAWLEPRLPSAIRYALWDRCMVCHVLPHAPLEGAGGRDLAAALRAGRAPDEAAGSSLARFLDRRISSPVTQLQQERRRSVASSAPLDGSPLSLDAPLGSGQSTPRTAGEATPLRSMYGDDLRRWLEFGSDLSVPNLRRHAVQLSNRYTVGAFLSGLMRVVQEECPSLSCHLCRATEAGPHVLCDVAEVDGDNCDGLILVGHGYRDDYARAVAHRLSFSGQLQGSGSTEGGAAQCSSVPPSPGPASAGLVFRSPGETAGSAGPPPPRQKLAWARVHDKQVELYTYNWPKEKWEHLHHKSSDLCQWTNARCSLLHSIVAQKLGLFHHQPFTRRHDQSTDQGTNIYQNQMSHIVQLIRQAAPPSQPAGPHRPGGGRTRLFTETLRDCKPGPLPPPGPAADAVCRHGQQLTEVYRVNRKGDEQKKLYHQCQTLESLDKDSTMESFVRLLKGSGRLLHFCFTPLLLLPSWHVAADERWHETLCTLLLGEYLQYLQKMGFLPLQYGLKGPRRPEAAEPAVVAYLYRVILGGGGYLLFQIGVEEPFFYVKLYALEGLRVRLRGRAAPINPQMVQSYLAECDDIRAHTHLHSYMHDYHLRMMQQYVGGRPLLLRQGLHIISFLEDFYNYYPKGPTHARNFMATGSVTFEEQTSTTPDQLYNYLLTHEKRYKMRVLRMIPLFEDSGEETTEDEYVLVQLNQREVRRAEPAQQPVVYDLALVVSRDLADPAADTRLRLKFYVLMTSRDIYPKVFIERKFENYRRVDTAPGVLADPPTAPSSGSVVVRDRRSQRSETSGTSSEDATGTSSSGSGFFSSYSTLRPESVHYLGYFSSHEQYMQVVLADEVERVRRRILEVVGRAKVHCSQADAFTRRDSLWQRLREEDERTRGSSAGGLSCAEMTELLTLVCCQPLEDIDPRLSPLVQQPLSWYSGLIRTLTHKYSDSHRWRMILAAVSAPALSKPA